MFKNIVTCNMVFILPIMPSFGIFLYLQLYVQEYLEGNAYRAGAQTSGPHNTETTIILFFFLFFFQLEH